MAKFLSDENFNGHVVRGLWRHHPEIDLERVHDIATVPGHVRARIAAGLSVAGICYVIGRMSVAQAVEQIAMAAFCLSDDEWRNTPLHLPL